MKHFYSEWLSAAKDDLDTVTLLLSQPNLTNILSFHAHQCIEKTFKAVIEKHSSKPQKTHNLEKLYEQVKQFLQISIDEVILETINELYIDSRYPGDLGLLPDGKPTLEKIYINRFIK
jgi:HEPN domain-containing protein